MKNLYAVVLASSLLFVACRETPVEPSAEQRVLSVVAGGGERRVAVLTQNLYVGADVDAVIGALVSTDPSDDFPALFSAINTFQETDYVARLGAMADRIARIRPHAVGLQEVSRLDIDLTGLGVPLVIHADFLETLMKALAARGVHYAVAATVQNLGSTPVPGITLVDSDVLLVDQDRVTVEAAGGRTYSANLGLVAPGVDLKRGWVWAQARVDGQPWYFVSTHLEGSAPGMPELLAAQATELAASLPVGEPVIAMGDFNAEPGSLAYQVMTGSGFTDAWRSLRPGVVGYSCCHVADLSDHVPNFYQRIDYVFTRGMGQGTPGLQGDIDLLGEVPADRIAGPAHPIWPSDHAGLAADLFGGSN